MQFTQPVDDQVLRIIRILVFIHQDIKKFILIFFQHIREITKKDIGIQQEVVEIHCAGFPAACCIHLEDLAQHGTAGDPVTFPEFLIIEVRLRGDKIVLGGRNTSEDLTGFIDLLIKL